jgi:hypothetical protein
MCRSARSWPSYPCLCSVHEQLVAGQGTAGCRTAQGKRTAGPLFRATGSRTRRKNESRGARAVCTPAQLAEPTFCTVAIVPMLLVARQRSPCRRAAQQGRARRRPFTRPRARPRGARERRGTPPLGPSEHLIAGQPHSTRADFHSHVREMFSLKSNQIKW